MKIHYILLSALLATSTISCSNVFDSLETNPNQQDVNGFYDNPDNINKGVKGIYSYITTPRAMGAGGCRLLANRGDESSDCSDYGVPGQYNAKLSPSWYTLVQPYQLFYTAISQSCQMIESIPNVKFFDKEQQNAYLGEAYFLRAFSHFFLFMNFRNIPVMKEMPKSAKNYQKLSKPEDTWDFIISDLQKALTLLPNKGYWKKEDVGRVTAASAAALLGKCYLYRSGIEKYYGTSDKSYYSEAAEMFNNIITGKYGNYKLVDNYDDNFKVKTENNDESIFELQFLGDTENTGFNPGLATGGVWRDPRGYYPPTISNPASQVMHDWIYQTFVNSKDKQGFTDSRMFGTLIFDDKAPEIKAKPGNEVRVFDDKTFREYYGDEGFASSGNAQAAKYKSAGRKGIDWTLPTKNPGNKMFMWNARAQGLNYTYIRYADVLLMYAESVFMGGKQGSITALDALNQVRARKSVNMPPVDHIDMKVIENERILELTEEGHRFFDLLRWGKVAERFKELETTDPNFKKYNTSEYLGFIKDKDEWLPIPVDEVAGNPYIHENNKGWN